MTTWAPEAATAVIGLAAFQLWEAWQQNAPSIADCREAEPGSVVIRQKLLDAEMTVGGLAVTIGLIFTVLTKNASALIIMLFIFAALVFMHHWILAAPPV